MLPGAGSEMMSRPASPAHTCHRWLAWSLLAIAVACSLSRLPTDPLLPAAAPEVPDRVDPAAWGADHVGEPVPEYMTGDECLFCHRKKVGPSWSKNSHQTSLQLVPEGDPGLKQMAANPKTRKVVEAIQFILGGDLHSRYLRRSGAYGKLDLLSVGWKVGGPLVDVEKPRWDLVQFGKGCAGCHTTGVDSKKHTFSATSIDCYACHGQVQLGHTNNTRLVHLSRKRADSPQVVASICGQCHVRDGLSRSTGLPFANNFIAGDNLFRDMKVDLSQQHIDQLNPADRHVMQNIREIVLEGKKDVTCLSCHDVHDQSSGQHQELAEQKLCFVCHNRTGPRSELKPYSVHSTTCGY